MVRLVDVLIIHSEKGGILEVLVGKGQGLVKKLWASEYWEEIIEEVPELQYIKNFDDIINTYNAKETVIQLEVSLNHKYHFAKDE